MSSAVSGHKGRDRWMRALAAASDLSAMALRLTLRLCVSFNCKTGRCDPGYPKLAEDMGISERTVFRAIAELEAGGWVSVDRTVGDNTRNAQINLLIPGAGATRSDDSMLSPEKEPIGATSDDNMLSPENPSLQVTENGPSDDRKPGVQVTHSVAGQKNLKPENLKSPVLRTGHTSRVDRESDDSTATDGPVARAAHAPLNDHLASQKQPPPSSASENIDPPAANGADADAGRLAQFRDVKRVWPRVRIDEGKAHEVFLRVMAAGYSLQAVIDAVGETLMAPGDVPWLSEALQAIEGNPRPPTGSS